MQPRTYVRSLIAVAAVVISAIAGANLLLDPQGVFGTGVVPRSANANQRYLRFVTYRANSDRYDGAMFGSSRAQAFDLDDLSRRTDTHVASFSVARGTIVDHLAVLDFVIRDKAAKRAPLRAVFLLIDMDIFGMSSFVNSPIQYLQPPAITGDNAARFWWRNLTAFQYQTWRDTLRYARQPESEKVPIVAPRLNAMALAVASERPGAAAPPVMQVGTLPVTVTPSYRISARPDYGPHLESLKRFVATCREHGIWLVMATAPLNPATIAQYDPADLDWVVGEISRIAPVWDFTTAGQLIDSADLWLDEVHFDSQVADVMLNRIFNGPVPALWAGFGRLRTPR
jgi:hypothetical protein